MGNVPDNFYIYKFRTEDEAIVIRNLNDSFPINRNSNILATFEPNLNLTIQSTDNFFPIETLLPEIYEVNISDLLIQEGKGYENKKFPSLIDKRNALRRLLLSVWNQLLKEKGLLVYEMSGKRYAYYQPIYNGIHRNINLNCKTRYNRTRRKQITGKFKDYFWHYALSTRILTSPILGYDLKSHIVFTKDGKDYINDTKIQHRLRRAKGKNMFNKSWRDLLLAYIQNLKGEDNKIRCNVGYNGLYVELKDCTLMFKCDYDYLDPNTPMSEYNIEGFYIEEFDEEYE